MRAARLSLLARRFARASALLVAGGLLLAGCGRRENPLVRAAQEGILYWGNGTEIEDLDPHLITGVPEHHVLLALAEGLLTPDPVDLSPAPGVAERYDVSEDGRTYTFFLRRDARWSDGTALTAHDFVRSLQRILTPSLGAEYAMIVYDFLDQGDAYYRGEIDDFSRVGVRALDPYTLEIRLKHPTPFFPKILATHQAWFPVPIHVIERLGGMDRPGSGWTRAENFVGNGPFRLKAWRPRQVLIAEKNPHYWDRDRVRLNEVHFLPIENVAAEERAFRTGQLHRTYDLPLGKIDTYRAAGSPALRVEPFLGSYFYLFNTTRPPFNDRRVRRAFALAVDRETIVTELLRGGQQPAYRLTPDGFPGYTPEVRLRGTVEEARQLLADAGYPGGRGLPPVEVLYNTHESHRAIAVALQEMWRHNLGVSVTLRQEEWRTYLNSQDRKEFSLCRLGWVADYAHPHTFLELFVTNGGNNDTGWSNARYDALRAQSLAAANDAERFALYEQMEQILVDELPILPLYHYTRIHLVHPSLQGYHSNPLDVHPYKYLWLDPELAATPP